MIEQFRQRYPLGSLTSELLKIYHGKYLVQASVQVDGIILSTGMGEGETIEQAEDAARKRAIAALALESNTIPTPIDTTTPQKSSPATAQPTMAAVPDPPAAAAPAPLSAPPAIPEVGEPSMPKPVEPLPTPADAAPSTPSIPPETQSSVPETLPLPLETAPLPPAIETPSRSTPVANASVVPIAAAATPPPAISPVASASMPQQSVNAPVDFSEIIAQSDVELKRLGWDSEQGRNYLLETYGKRSRQLLSDEELIEFLQHLQSLPSPVAS